MEQDPTSQSISPPEVRAALRDVCASDLLVSLERLKAFLSYIVEEELAGRGAGIRGKTIAQDVYDRDPQEGTDSDNIVRVDARRIRQLLDHYYQTAGAADQVRIRVDTGRYRPRFERIEVPAEVASRKHQRSFLLPGAMFVAGSGIGFALTLAFTTGGEGTLPEPSETNLQRILERQAIYDKSPTSLQAVNLAEQARGMIFPIFDRPRQQLVTEVFRRVIELDPDYYGGYAGAAQTLSTLAVLTPPGDEREARSALADEMSSIAVRLEPTNAWTQSARGWSEFANGNYDEAIRFVRRSAELSPKDVSVLDFLGTVSLFSGQFEEAIAAAELGFGNGGSADRSANRNIFAAASFHLGEYEDSLAAFQVAAEFGGPISAPAIAFQAAGLQALGRTEEARKKMEEFTTGWPSADLRSMLRGIYQNPEHADAVTDYLGELGWPSAATQE